MPLNSKFRFSRRTFRIAAALLVIVGLICGCFSIYNVDDRVAEWDSKPSIDLPSQKESSGVRFYNGTRGNDIILSLVRNEELQGMLQSIEEFENRFNKRFHYDWWFLNDKPFSEEFINGTKSKVSGSVKYITLPKQYFDYPDNIDLERAAQVRKTMKKQKVAYGDSESYRFMCRFNSGMFYKLPELEHVEYYWRVEPFVNFKCDINYDVFEYMRQNDKLYGFAMSLGEDKRTIPTLWEHTRKYFFDLHPELIADRNNINFISDDEGATYNGCHFWTNFEIAHTEIFKDPGYGYEAYFEYLDSIGGFFYERWGDAPVHTLAFSLLLDVDQIHFVPNTGYFHHPNQDCPRDDPLKEALNCECQPKKDFTWHKWSCVNKFFDVNHLQRPDSLSQVKKHYPYLLPNPTGKMAPVTRYTTTGKLL
ncbi:unnamed protein product [Kluyveromyces dobzhanskii CBS 2104]|uniref:WGS project CCBQ000000000 data, contig 00012 n=1 Tax=Kluyveromyces dobzhanskii CBS 2104 TaxID=1427455 RepID=A0A0A8L0R5_9SACH|nr:unnamed protein product [Kluyveromyces dobzhanskii CBS 2104]